MKTFIALAIVVVLAAGCSKKDSSSPVTPPVVLPDTLGVGWSKVTVTGSAGFSDIFFANADTGYAISDHTYKSTDGGSSWQSIFANSGINLFVTPNGNIFSTGDNGRAVLKSSDGGAIFTTSNIPIVAPPTLFDLYFTGNDTGYLPAGNNSLFRTTDKGNTWTAIPSITGLTINNTASFLIPFFINSTTGWISNSKDIYKTNGSDASWTVSSFTSDKPVYGPITLHGINAGVVYAAGHPTSSQTALYKSVDGGSVFSVVKKFENNGRGGYPDIHFLDINNGYVCVGNRLYKTTDGGINWTTVVALGNATVVEIHFTDINHGWACCNDETILKFRP